MSDYNPTNEDSIVEEIIFDDDNDNNEILDSDNN